jgi:uncharacterized cupredoxin-like copper-binding protein
MRRAASALTIAAAAACAALSGCGSTSAHAARSVHVTVGDFRIKAPTHVRAGDVDFVVHNNGPDEHELIVIRASAPLPLRRDGVTADEAAFERRTVGALEPGVPGSTRTLHVHLKPGRYELICNMNGHFLGGMRALVEVT